MSTRSRRSLHDRIIAMLAVLALLAGLGPSVHAASMQHAPDHLHAPSDGMAAERAGHHGAPAGDQDPAGHASTGCCHAVCPASVMPPDGSCERATVASGDGLRLGASTRLDGLRHAPPLRPPR